MSVDLNRTPAAKLKTGSLCKTAFGSYSYRHQYHIRFNNVTVIKIDNDAFLNAFKTGNRSVQAKIKAVLL